MKYLFLPNIENFRYERKFYIEGLTGKEAEAILKFHPAIFKEIYHERTVNNIYFDTFGLKHYFDNVNGVSKRLKVRVRWYGDLFGFIKSPTLELKLKHNLHVAKLLYPLESFTLDHNFSIDVMRDMFKRSPIHEVTRLRLMGLNFSLLYSYNRKYFLSSNRKYRMTIDTGMQGYKLSPYQNTFLHKSAEDTHVVFELKYNRAQDEFVDTITSYFPFRMTRNSKYVDGIMKLDV